MNHMEIASSVDATYDSMWQAICDEADRAEHDREQALNEATRTLRSLEQTVEYLMNDAAAFDDTLQIKVWGRRMPLAVAALALVALPPHEWETVVGDIRQSLRDHIAESQS